MIKGIHHLAIATPDLDRLVSFYRTLFDGEIVKEFAWEAGNEAFNARLGLADSAGRIVLVGFGQMLIEFFQFSLPASAPTDGLRSVAKSGFSHVCFEADDCQAEYDRLSEAGMPFHATPLKMPAGGIFAYGRDPDGNIIEILQRPPS